MARVGDARADPEVRATARSRVEGAGSDQREDTQLKPSAPPPPLPIHHPLTQPPNHPSPLLQHATRNRFQERVKGAAPAADKKDWEELLAVQKDTIAELNKFFDLLIDAPEDLQKRWAKILRVTRYKRC